MALIVQKYGGTSVGSPERIKRRRQARIASWQAQGHRLVVVVSAMSGETNRLIALAKDDPRTPTPANSMSLISTGEQVTIGLLAMALIRDLGLKAKQLYRRPGACPDRQRLHQGAHRAASTKATSSATSMTASRVVVAGFQGVDEDGNITTLGRGGSDTSAVALAAALKADECQIYTDVDGVYTTDPRIVPEARRLETITFEEMMEMASLGSKVLQIRSVEFAGKYKVKLRVLSSLEELGQEGPGTLITSRG
jgi:aspartate kinase